MNLLNKRLVLTYSLDETEFSSLKEHFEKSGVKVINVEDNMGDMTVASILKEEKSNEEVQDELIKEKVIIFNGFKGNSLSNTIGVVRQLVGKEPILAASTPFSINMKFKLLLEHLVEEREYHKNK